MNSNLTRYLSNTEGNVFALINLPPEVRAVLFAYYSRSPKSLKETLAEVLEETGEYSESSLGLQSLEEKAAKFHEKWVVGYAHSSVAEHAVLSLGIENISILATKALEDNRLCSYTEKSTRYVEFDKDSYFKAPELDGTPFAGRYHDLCGELLTAYTSYLDELREKIAARFPKGDMSERLYSSKINGMACDIARYLLPAATLTNVGLTANARNIAWMVSKMKSYNLPEVQQLGIDIQTESTKICPTLIRYADENEFLIKIEEIVKSYARGYAWDNLPSNFHYFDIDPDVVLETLITAFLYGYEFSPFEDIVQPPMGMLDEIMEHRGPHDRLPREFEIIPCSSEISVDYGAFRDIQRHRMCTQINEPFNPGLGYDYPLGIQEGEELSNYDQLMSQAKNLYHDIVAYDSGLMNTASYCLPMAYRKRTLIQWNLREAGHFIELRSKPQGHLSYRGVAQRMWSELNDQCPEVMKHIRVCFD